MGVFPLKIEGMLRRLAIDNPNKFKLAAGVVYKKHLVATGINSYKTHPLQAKYGGEHKIHLHAEVDAIKNALRLLSVDDLRHCTLYVLRVKRPSIGSSGWVYANAKPCQGCARCIADFNLKAVHWTEECV